MNGPLLACELICGAKQPIHDINRIYFNLYLIMYLLNCGFLISITEYEYNMTYVDGNEIY